MLELTKDNFEDEVLQGDDLVVVDYWSDSCDRCLEIMPDVKELAEQYSDKAKFAKLNIKGNRRLAIGQKVLGLPSIVFYKDGEKLEHLSGEDLEVEDIEQTLQKMF